jgi:hypothetical protein
MERGWVPSFVLDCLTGGPAGPDGSPGAIEASISAEALAGAVDGHRRPGRAGRRRDAAIVESARDLASALAFEFGEDGAQRLGPRLGLVAVGDALRVEPAELHALRFLRLQCVPRALRDQPALFLGQGGIEVQHERVSISAQLCHDEGRSVRHQARDEMDIAAQAIELRNQDRRFRLLGGLEHCGELRPAIERISALARLDLLERLHQPETLGLGEAGQRGLLRFHAQAGLGLLSRGNPDVGDSVFHGATPIAKHSDERCYVARPS